MPKYTSKPTKRTGSSWLVPLQLVQKNKNDVVLGRGNDIAKFAGNRSFRRIVWKHRNQYQFACRNEKGRVAEEVIKIVSNLDPPGRFIERCCLRDEYFIVTHNRAMEKTCQALREKKHTEPDDLRLKKKTKTIIHYKLSAKGHCVGGSKCTGITSELLSGPSEDVSMQNPSSAKEDSSKEGLLAPDVESKGIISVLSNSKRAFTAKGRSLKIDKAGGLKEKKALKGITRKKTYHKVPHTSKPNYEKEKKLLRKRKVKTDTSVKKPTTKTSPATVNCESCVDVSECIPAILMNSAELAPQLDKHMNSVEPTNPNNASDNKASTTFVPAFSLATAFSATPVSSSLIEQESLLIDDELQGYHSSNNQFFSERGESGNFSQLPQPLTPMISSIVMDSNYPTFKFIPGRAPSNIAESPTTVVDDGKIPTPLLKEENSLFLLWDDSVVTTDLMDCSTVVDAWMEWAPST